MGIDFDPGEAHWSYSGFHRFRCAIARTVGIDLDKMEGFYASAEEQILWDTVDSPLKPLFDHSDCDGELTPLECAQVAPALREVLARPDTAIDDYDRRHGELLCEAMEQCVREQRSLIFC